MAESPLAQKLNIKPNTQILILNAPENFQLADTPEGCTLTKDASQKDLDCVHIFTLNRAELDALLPTVLTALKPDGMLWVSYPKGSSKVETDLNRDRLWALLEQQGWEAVRQVSVDSIWSAMRFKPKAKLPQT